MIEVRTPANQFFDTDGTPLDNGYIYIGTTGANPETTPQAVYWDKDGTIPAAQPIRTINGFPARDGAVSKFYTSTKNYSITVKDKRGILVVGVLNSDSGVFDELSGSTGAAGVGYDGTTSGLSSSNVQDAIDEVQSNVDSVVAAQNSQSGLVNLFMNSAFLINHRGYVSGTATTGSNQYTLDRIRVVVSGQSLIFTPAAFGNRITAPAGGAEQVIEGLFVVGGDYACTWTGTGTIQVGGVVKAKNETFTLTAKTNATIRMFGEFENFVLTRPDMLGRYEYDYAADLRNCMRYAQSKNVRWRMDEAWTTGVNVHYTDHFQVMRTPPACSIVSNISTGFAGGPVPYSSKPTCVVWSLTVAAAGPVARELDMLALYQAEL